MLLRATAAGLCGQEADAAVVSRLLRSDANRGTISLRINSRDYTTELTQKDGKVQVKIAGLSPIQTNRWLVIGFPALRSIPWENPAGPEKTPLAEGSRSAPVQQSLSQGLVKGYRFLRCFRLADPDNLTDDGASYTRLLCVEVDVRPL